MSYPQCSFIRLPRPWRVDYRYRKVISKKEGAHVISDCGFSEIPLNQPTLRRIDLGIGLGEHLLLNLIPNEFARALRENGSIAGAFRVDHSTGGQLAIVEMNQISGKRVYQVYRQSCWKLSPVHEGADVLLVLKVFGPSTRLIGARIGAQLWLSCGIRKGLYLGKR